MLIEQSISSSKDSAELSRKINVVGININSDFLEQKDELGIIINEVER